MKVKVGPVTSVEMAPHYETILKGLSYWLPAIEPPVLVITTIMFSFTFWLARFVNVIYPVVESIA